nr:hypothetical protein [Bacillaceae bacterium]
MYRQKKKNFHIKGKKDKKSEKMKIGSDLQKIGGKGTEKWKTPTGKVMTIPVDSPTPGGMIPGKKKTGPWWENSREPGPGMEKTAMDLKSGGMILDRRRGVCIEVLKPLIPAELIR